MQVNPRRKGKDHHNNSEKRTINHPQEHAKGVVEPGILDKIVVPLPPHVFIVEDKVIWHRCVGIKKKLQNPYSYSRHQHFSGPSGIPSLGQLRATLAAMNILQMAMGMQPPAAPPMPAALGTNRQLRLPSATGIYQQCWANQQPFASTTEDPGSHKYPYST